MTSLADCLHCNAPLILGERRYLHGDDAAWVSTAVTDELTCAHGQDHTPYPGDEWSLETKRAHAATLVAEGRDLLWLAAFLDPDRCPPACSESHTDVAPCAMAVRAVVPDPMTITTGPIAVVAGDMVQLETKRIRVSAKPTAHL